MPIRKTKHRSNRNNEESAAKCREKRDFSLEKFQQKVGNRELQRLLARQSGKGSVTPDDDTADRSNQERGGKQHLNSAVQMQVDIRQPRILQCWSLGEHKKLTKEGIGILFSALGPRSKGFKFDGRALAKLANYSMEMDRKEPEFFFNVRGFLIGRQATLYHDWDPYPAGYPLGKKRRQLLDKRRKLKAYKKLLLHYRKHPIRAKNHGEGGLYWLPDTKATGVNEQHQKQYEQRARRVFSVKPIDRDSVFEAIGDALHVAQDRGAHGEGAARKGHALQIFQPEFDPDDKSINATGYKEAQYNTDMLLWRVEDILFKLLNRHWNRKQLRSQR